MVYKDTDDAFPLQIRGWQAQASADVNAWNEVKGSIRADYASSIQGLIFRLDELNQGIMFAFKAAYVAYTTNPCSGTFSRQVDRIIKHQEHLREFQVKVQGLISLAQLNPNNPKLFFAAFVEIVHHIGGPAEVDAAIFEIAENRARAREWAEGEHEG